MTTSPSDQPRASRTEGVLLDLDGTLLDTNHLHTLAWWRAFRRFGLTFPMQQIHARIGMGGDKLVPDLVGRAVDGASEAWSEEFRRFDGEVTLLPGAREVVERLHDLDLRVVLATSAPAEDLERFRELLDVDRWLAGATSSDDVDRSKPDAEIFEAAMDTVGLDASTTIALGDTVWDAAAADRAGIVFVGVETGGTTAADLRAAGAVASYPDLPTLLDDLDRGPFAPPVAPDA